MIQSKITKLTALAACMSLLFALPIYAGNPQGSQNNINNMNHMNMNTSPGGINMNISPGGIHMNASPGGINLNASPGGIHLNASPGGIDFNTSPGGVNIPQNGMQNQQGQQNQQLSNAAQFMVNQGIIKGNTSGIYAMSDNVKRGDMSLMLVRAFDLDTSDTSNTESSTSNFNDVSKSSYYYSAVNMMKDMGIAQGDGQNFNPTRYMTLQEAILFVERALDVSSIDYTESDLTTAFGDRSLSEYATREDVSTLLYAVLGDEYVNLVTTESAVTTTASTITYTTSEDTSITFDEDDFDTVCEDATEETISYVRFSLPSTSFGKLYYNYTSSTDYDDKVASTDKYYFDADDDHLSLSGITFVPKEGYTGTVKINYVGNNADGDTFTGTVKVTIE